MAKKIIRVMKKIHFGLDVNGPCFTSAITIIIIIALTHMYKDGAEEVYRNSEFVANKAGWFYIKCKYFQYL
jgi:choline/glycine/proline betaine transport protein